MSNEKTCNDCGVGRRWKWAGELGASENYCKRDNLRAGNRVTVELSPDKIERLLGEEIARRVISECRDWPPDEDAVDLEGSRNDALTTIAPLKLPDGFLVSWLRSDRFRCDLSRVTMREAAEWIADLIERGAASAELAGDMARAADIARALDTEWSTRQAQQSEPAALDTEPSPVQGKTPLRRIIAGKPLGPLEWHPKENGLTLPGWTCPHPGCGVFNGEAKEVLSVCRSCGGPRPGSASK